MIEVTPRELVVSLPHGLRGHVAYSEASDWLAEQAKMAEKADKAAGGEGAGGRKRKAGAGAGAGAPPPLTELFSIGQLVRCSVTALRDGGQEGGDVAEGGKKKEKGKKGGGERKQRKRVDVSLRLSKLCAGLGEGCLGVGCPLQGWTQPCRVADALGGRVRSLQPCRGWCRVLACTSHCQPSLQLLGGAWRRCPCRACHHRLRRPALHAHRAGAQA